jgi:hypothetical protein
MKTDQDLIFEAYNKTLNEGSHLYGDTELGAGKYKASDVTITDYDIEDLAPVGVGGGYEMVPVEFEDDNGTTMTGIVDSLYIDDTGAVDASGMIHDAEAGTLADEDNEDINVADDYPDHEQILSNIREIVDENIGHGEGHEHSRETLDDIISDLVQYRNGLPSTDDYMKGGKL